MMFLHSLELLELENHSSDPNGHTPVNLMVEIYVKSQKIYYLNYLIVYKSVKILKSQESQSCLRIELEVGFKIQYKLFNSTSTYVQQSLIIYNANEGMHCTCFIA